MGKAGRDGHLNKTGSRRLHREDDIWQRPGGDEGMSHGQSGKRGMIPGPTWEINFPGKENNQCQAPGKEEF